MHQQKASMPRLASDFGSDTQRDLPELRNGRFAWPKCRLVKRFPYGADLNEA